MLNLNRLAWLKAGAPPRNVAEAAFRARLAGGGAYEKTVGPAPIISVSDAKAEPAKSLIVGIEPIQDLHGYANPWPAGGGKNKLLITATTQTVNDVTFTVSNGIVTLSGTASARAVLNLATNFSLKAGTYKMNGSQQTLPSSCYLNLTGGGVNVSEFGSNFDREFTLSEDSTMNYIRLDIASGTNTNGLVFKPMIRLSSVTDATYAPYENVCPISGRTGMTVTRTGKNLLDFGAFCIYENWSAGITNYGTYPTSNSNKGVLLNGIKAGETYTLSFGISQQSFPATYLYLCSADGVNSYRDCVFTNTGYLRNSFTFTAQVGRIYYIRSGSTSSKSAFEENVLPYIGSAQLELGSTVSPYTPYAGQTYPVSWQSEAGTVYGGTLDVVSGLLTVTMAQIASYNGEALPGKWISDRDVYAEGTSPTTGAQVVYELATLQTYQLTPTEVEMLLGANTLWSDSGDLTLTYTGEQKPGV